MRHHFTQKMFWRDVTILAVGMGYLFFLACTVQASPADQNVTDSCFNSRGEKAVDSCRQLLHEDATHLKLMKRLADLLVELERFDESLHILNLARKKYPQNKRIAYKIKVTKSMEAEKILFADEEETSSAKADLKKSRTSAKVSRLLCLKIKGERGLKACEEAIESYPQDSSLHRAYGDLLSAYGQKDRARKEYVEAEKLQLPEAIVVKKIVRTSQKTVVIAKDEYSKEISNNTSNIQPKSLVGAESGSIEEKMHQLKNLYDQKLIDGDEYKNRKFTLMNQTFGKIRTEEETSQRKKDTTIPQVNYGDYFGLVIGVQNYKYLTKLEMASNDAQEVSKLLKKAYGFKVEVLEDPTRREILMALGKMRRTLRKSDNLLIYYAGHGLLDRAADVGYWLPVDAASDNDIDWLSLNSVTSAARAIPAKHLMIVADSCFSGKLTRGIIIKIPQTDRISRMASKRVRVVLTSGGLEPVLDAGGGDHSVFAAAFLEILRENKDVIDGTTLFSLLRRNVMLNASQTPEYSDIRKAGHEGGDFLFVRTFPK